MRLSKIENNIRLATREAQRLVDAEFANCNGKPEEGSVLDQLGLTDAKHIIEEYLSAGEAGLAFEHLVYMIEETDIAISNDTLKLIRDTGIALKSDISI